jgi:hypothetical protein
MSQKVKADPIAVRAVNQYRRRDVLPYLALRYYLASTSTRFRRWAEEVSVPLLMSRTSQPYFISKHFKERAPDGSVLHRSLHLPSANEALAEAFLLDACAENRAFANPGTVFSYALASGEQTEGVFVHYFKGLRRRHEEVAASCKAFDAGVVKYLDIKKFYPSIKVDVAANAWKAKCQEAGLSAELTGLGMKLIEDHRVANERALLTGPMISHLLGNLVLRPVDDLMGRAQGVKYFRYVDDVVLVGSEADVKAAHGVLEQELAAMGLVLHGEDSPKHIQISARDWLKGEHDFSESKRRVNWMTLIGSLKQYLMRGNEAVYTVGALFKEEGVWLPLLDYSGAARERSYLTRFKELATLRWFRRQVRRRDLADVLDQVKSLRISYRRETRELLEEWGHADVYGRKRLLPKLRYRLGRLLFLGEEQEVRRLAEEVRAIPELLFQASVMRAVVTGEVDEVLRLGTNVAQAAAQVLRASRRPVRILAPIETEEQMQGLAILLFNGVDVRGDYGGSCRDSELVRLARSGSDDELMRSKDEFIRELACLHGKAPLPRHPEVLESAFDEDQDLAHDVLTALGESVSP